MGKGEANPGVVVMGEAQEAAEDHNHIQVQRVVQVKQEVEAAHSHYMQEVQVVQVVKMMVHPYLGTSRHNMPHQTLPDPAASLRLCKRRRIL